MKKNLGEKSCETVPLIENQGLDLPLFYIAAKFVSPLYNIEVSFDLPLYNKALSHDSLLYYAAESVLKFVTISVNSKPKSKRF
jgi:hypothetical protein